MFRMGNAITSVSGDFSSLKNGMRMFWGGAKLTAFHKPLPSLEEGTCMFNACYLDNKSVDIISDSLPSYTTGNHRIDIQCGADKSTMV